MEKYLDALPKTIPNEVGELAILLHQQKNNTLLSIGHGGRLPIDAHQPDCELWAIQGDEIIFSSIETRNQCVALHTFQTSFPDTSKISGAKLFELAYEIWCDEIGSDSMACPHFLAIASKHINIRQSATELIYENGDDIFDILRFVGFALPHLPEIIIEDLCALIIAQHQKTKHDLANGILFNAIEDALLQRPRQFSWNLYRHVQANFNESLGNLCTPALIAISKSGDLENAIAAALVAAESKNAVCVHCTLWSVARILTRIFHKKGQECCNRLIK